jgi:ferredoxin
VKPHVTLDPDVCIGSGGCVERAPGAFRLTDEGFSVIVDPTVVAPHNLLDAEVGCPVQAITVDLDP